MLKSTEEKIVFQRPKTIKKDYDYTFCPGCGHGVVLRLVAECIDELGVPGDTIAVASVGCSICLEKYFDLDVVGSSHGRAPCVATGVKRAKPDKVVFTYQGDGDAATIGMNETILGMTGGQASATSVIGQKTATTPLGRDPKTFGYPLKISEMVAMCDGACYVERCGIYSPKSILQTKRAIKHAFENQIKGLGFSFVEVLTTCPTGWKMKPVDAMKFIENELTKTHKLGVFKDITNEK